ncbi:MAG: glycosyltransferase family 2 protein [Bacteroidales bacterium]|nr:glycosyltransferase family 2 protein [Bacteroidales bacterium]
MSDLMFSIVCPTYNHADYIQQCVKSVLSQTYGNWELLILDDGSTDGTGEKIAPFLRDNRVKYFYQENKGAGRLAENYNFLLSKAQGTYVTILEGDDYAEPGLLAAHHKAFAESPDSILSFNRVRVDESGYLWEAPIIPKNQFEKDIYENKPIGNGLKELFFRCFIPAQGASVRRSTLLDCGGFEKVEGLPTVDYPTWLKLAQKGTFVFVPEVLATWRRHMSQSTKQRIVVLTETMNPVFEKVYDELSSSLKEILPFGKSNIKKHWEIQLTKILVRSGNYQLQSHNWKKAREYYFRSFTHWPSLLLIWRIKAKTGILFSWFHIPWFQWNKVKKRLNGT